MPYQKHFQRSLFHVVLALMLLAPLLVLSTGAAYAQDVAGHVFTLSNETDGNDVLVFDRASDGTLTFATSVETGGLGTGAGLGSQGALILAGDWLLAVNAGSSSVSIFRLTSQGLELRDVEPSGGEMPISVTRHRDVVYVLNAGGAGNISGFRMGPGGDLDPIAGATLPLSNGGVEPGVGPAQIQFTPDGRRLVVTEKDTNLIDVYTVGSDGLAAGPAVSASSGMTPFGFAFTKRGQLVVSEAFGGAPGASAVSSYRVSSGGVQVISPSVANAQSAACWVVITRNGRYAYITNTGSNNISSYEVRRDGKIRLLNAAAATTGMTPIDMSLSADGAYLYALAAGADAIDSYRVNADGSLESIDFDEGLPASSVGIAAR